VEEKGEEEGEASSKCRGGQRDQEVPNCWLQMNVTHQYLAEQVLAKMIQK